ncbi:3-deoxy-D-manno-octulosonic acid transferase [bacterium]|nr:3-deoxy-D-manno-octulosonic acid transferase [bacterium]
MFFWFYTVLLWLALPFLLLYFTLVSVRGNIRGTLMQRFGFLNSGALPADVPRIWFHAASVGEVRTVMELIHGIRQQYGKDVTILLSVMTKTGYEVAVKENEPDLVFFLPFDIPVIVRRVYRRLKPQVLVVFETELWPNLFRLTPKNDCRLMLANGRMSGSSFTNYRHFIRIIRPVLQAVDRFCLQTEEYAERYQALGADPDKIIISGNIKDEQSGRLVAKFPAEKVTEIIDLGQSLVLAAVSTHAGEEKIWLEIFRKLQAEHENLKLIIAPRHLFRTLEIIQLFQQENVSFIQRSAHAVIREPQVDVILWDTFGELGWTFNCANVVFVGGSLAEIGGHSLMEPAAFGKPVIWGPHISHFNETARQLLTAGGGFQVDDADAALKITGELFTDSTLRLQAGKKAAECVQASQGAIQLHLGEIATLLSE